MSHGLERSNLLEVKASLSSGNEEEQSCGGRTSAVSLRKPPVLLLASLAAAAALVSLIAASSWSKGSLFLGKHVADGRRLSDEESGVKADGASTAIATNLTTNATAASLTGELSLTSWELEPLRKDSTNEVPVEEMGIFQLKSLLSGGSLDDVQRQSAEEKLKSRLSPLSEDRPLSTPMGWGNTSSLDLAGMALQMAQTSSSSASSASCGVREYSGRQWGSDLCFCELAGNPACQGSCVCPQGCGSQVTWEHSDTVTFANKARAEGCAPSTVLLTAPKAYFETPWDLARAGSECATEVVRTLLLDSWDTYQKEVGKGSIWQCFHNSQIATVRYLHLQTFCESGSFHAMPSDNQDVAHCVKMDSLDHGHVDVLTKDLVRMIR
mmetsp:Transcript_60105/g.127340  ORF Transcript_60105/g.127340 Transcript_60105/m.127340 type:complete len:381 (+) Transcript_60105:342-1484(+)